MRKMSATLWRVRSLVNGASCMQACKIRSGPVDGFEWRVRVHSDSRKGVKGATRGKPAGGLQKSTAFKPSSDCINERRTEQQCLPSKERLNNNPSSQKSVIIFSIPTTPLARPPSFTHSPVLLSFPSSKPPPSSSPPFSPPFAFS